MLSSDSDSGSDFDLQDHELFYISSSDMLSRESSTASDTCLPPPVVGRSAIAALSAASQDLSGSVPSAGSVRRSPPVSPRSVLSDEASSAVVTQSAQSAANQYLVSQRLGIAERDVLADVTDIAIAMTNEEEIDGDAADAYISERL